MSDQTTNLPDPSETSKKEFEEQMARERDAQGLPEGAVPEQRPQASTVPIVERTPADIAAEEQGVDHHAPAMDKEAYDRASSDKQLKQAAKESFGPERYYPGATCKIVDEDSPLNGVHVAINGVNEWASTDDELLANAGTPNSRFAQVKSYDVSTRDGRAVRTVIDADKLEPVDRTLFGRTA